MIMDQLFRLFGSSEQLWQYIQKYAKKAGIEGNTHGFGIVLCVEVSRYTGIR